MIWKDMPPLAALRAFEAAARNLSFSGAARDLNVTHAAIAQQVRALERHLSLPLIYREGRGLALTAAGVTLASALRDGFGTISAAVLNLTLQRAGQPLRITITPSFAAQWLMPRLGAFWAHHADIPLSLHPDRRIFDLRHEQMDLGIRFGDGKWPGLDAELLTPAQYTVVAAPQLLGGRNGLSIAEMTLMPWVMEEDWPEQRTWLMSIGIDPAQLRATRVPTEELALSAARQGYGLHVENIALVEEELASGRLCTVYRAPLSDLGYYLVTVPGPIRPALRIFIRWLKSVA